MRLKDELNAFYYSNALCDLRLMNKNMSSDMVTYNSLLYLEIIYSMNGKCTASKLAKMLGVSKPGVTSKINELIKQGLVIKVPCKTDKRKNMLYVNEDAVPQYRVYRQQDDLAVSKITDMYNEEDIQKFCDMLRIITDINYSEIEGNSKL